MARNNANCGIGQLVKRRNRRRVMRTLIASTLAILLLAGAAGCIQQIYSDTASEQILHEQSPH
jgi:hypothetical protein